MTDKEARAYSRSLAARRQPECFDRMLATNFGAARCARSPTVDGKMVALQAGTVVNVPLSEAINVKTVPVEGQLVRSARDIGISFAAPNESKL